jgi:tetratricopeptide (TPR) repeat protein
MTLPPVPQTGRRPLALPAHTADALLHRRHPHDQKDFFATDLDPEIRRLGRLALRHDDNQARVDDLFAIGDLCAHRALDDEGRLRVIYVGKALLAWQRASVFASHDIDRMTSARIIGQFVRWLWQAASEYPSLRNLSVVLWALSSDEPPPRASASGVPSTGGPVVADLLRRIEALLRPPTAPGDQTPAPDRTAAPAEDSLQTRGEDSGPPGARTMPSSTAVRARPAPLDDLTVSDSADPAMFESMQRDRAAGEPPRRAADLTYTREMSAVSLRAGEYAPGALIGDRYEVVDFRRGGMGIVFLCYDHQEREPVALKSFQARLLDNPRAVARFEQEALTWIRLEKHRHIVQARRVQKFNERPFLILEHVSGPEGLEADLRSWIERRRVTLPLALGFGLHIALGMQYAAQQLPGLVHRDLKPANILVTQDGIAKVTDFGLVRSFDLAELPADSEEEAPVSERLTRVGAVLGTAAYLSPEQCRSGPVDQRADVYAFGCVLYEMLTGHALFSARTFDEWLQAHLYETPSFTDELRTSLPPALAELTLACLQKAPDDRPASWSAIVETLVPLYTQVTGELPTLEISGPALAARELMDKGYSLTELGKYVEAVAAYDRAIALQPADAWAWARKGRTLRLLGRLPGALEAYDESLRLHPAYAWAWKGRGIVLEKLGRYEEALDCHRAAAQIDPDDVWNWYNQAESLQALGRTDEALQALERGLALDPQHANSWGRLGQLQRTRGHYQAAVDAYRKATEIDPAYGWAHNGCGLALRALGQPGEALVCFKRAARFQPEIVWHWYNLTETLTELGYYEDAVEAAREAVRVDATHAFSWAKLGQVLRYLKRFEESLSAYNRSLALHPDSAWAFNGKGIVLEQLGRFEEALAAYQRASALAPRDVWPFYNQGSVLIALGRPDEARQALEQALTRLPTHARSRALLGTALHQLGDLEAACAAFEAAVALDAAASWAWNEYGQVLRKLGRDDEALDALRRAGNPPPGETVLVFEQADLLMAREQFDEAVRLLEGYLAGKPRSQHGWAKLGQAQRRLGRHDEAIRACDRALELDPEYAWAWNVRGLALMALGECSEALMAFERACTLDKDSVWHWYNRADALAALRRFDDAAAMLERALVVAPDHAESWARLGQALRSLDRPAEALAACDEALRVRPAYAWAWHGRGLALQSLGRGEEALASFERARHEDPRSIWYYHSQVDLLLEMDRKIEALRVAEAGAAALPESAPAWARLGQVQRRLSQFQNAVVSYERAVELDPRYGWAWNGLGLAHTALNHADQSAEAFAQAVRFNPDDVWFWRNYGDALILLDACERATLAFERALALEPDHLPTVQKLALARDCVGEE